MAEKSNTHLSGLKIDDGDVLQLGSATTAPSSAQVGEIYYNSSTGKVMVYQATGWSSVDGTAAGSLDGAYNGGATIAVDAADVIFNLSDSSNDYNFEIRNTSSGTIASGLVVDAYATSSVFDDAISIITTAGAVTDGVDASDAGITNAINVGGNVIIGSTATINFTHFDVTGANGNTVIGGTLDVTGAVTLTAGITVGTTLAVTGASTLEGVVIIDGDNAEQFLIRENSDGGDILTIDTTSGAGDTTMLLTPVNTTGTGLHIDGSSFTTGDVLKITVAASTMGAAGAAISVVADGSEVFAVRDDGSVLMKGTGEGTTAASITTGDFVISDGDLTISGGEVAITDGVTTSGVGLALTSTMTTAGVATGTAGAMVITANSATTGTVLSVIADAITNGDLLYLDNGGGTMTTTTGFFINCNDDDTSAFTVSKYGAVVIAGNADTTVFTVTAGDLLTSNGSLIITDVDANQLSVKYDASNHFVVDVDNDGSTTLTTTGTNADFEIATGTNGDITLDSAADIILEAGGSDINANAPINVTVGTGPQLELINNASLKATFDVAATTANLTITASGGNANVIELVGTTITLDAAGDINFEAGGDDINMDCPLNITHSSGSQLELISASALKATFSSAATTANLTITASGGTENVIELVGDTLTFDSAGDIAFEAGGDDITMDAQLAITTSDNESNLVLVNNTLTTTDIADFSSTSITDGSVLKLNANTAAHDGIGLEVISAGDATSTPIGISVTMSAVAASTGADAAHGIWVDLPEATSGANGIEVRMDKITTADMLKLDAGGATMTGAGRYINCTNDSTILFSVATDGATVIAGAAAGTSALTLSLGDLVITDTDATTITSVNGVANVVEIISGGVIGAGCGCLVIDAAGALNATGSLLRLEGDGVTATNNPFAMAIDCNGIDMSGITADVDAATLSAYIFHCGGATANDKGVVHITSDGTMIAGSALLRIESTTAAAGATVYGLEIACNASNLEGLNVSAGTSIFTEAVTMSSTLTCKHLTEVVTGTNVIGADESGSTFFLASATEFVSTLPAPAAGLHFKFIVTAAPAEASYTITTNASANIIKGVAVNAAGAAGDTATGEDTISFVDGQALAGDWVDLECDGTNWFAVAYSAVAAGVTFTTAS